jgi:hypothetical protein
MNSQSLKLLHTQILSKYFRISLAFGLWVLYIVGVLDGHPIGENMKDEL